MKKSFISKASFSYKIEIAIFFYNFLLKKRNLNHSNKDKKKKIDQRKSILDDIKDVSYQTTKKSFRIIAKM